MSATLAALLADARLGLRLLTGHGPDPDALARPIRWVATSELDDPTPYLEGGELLLTTGMRLPGGRAEVDAYVGRLLDAGVVGLGYGVGVVTEAVPATLVRTAGRRGLPLVEVDQPTPFIAVSKAVSDLLAAERYAEVTKGFTGQQALARAAVTGQAPGVVAGLATALGGWAALLEPNGRVRCVSPASARSVAGALTGELDRLRGRRPTALALIHGDAHVVVHPLAATPGGRGFLAVGLARPLGTADRSLVNVATALLTFITGQPDTAQAPARARALLRLLLDGVRLGDDILVGLGGALLTRASPTVTALVGAPTVLDEVLLDLTAGLGDQLLAAVVDGDLIAVTATDEDQGILRRIVPDDGSVAMGTSRARSVVDVAEAVRRARQAAATARHLVPPVLDHDQIAATSAVGLVDPSTLAAYANGVLGPLDAYHRSTGIDLVESLGAWLDRHGHYESAAVSLRIHRHTLRYRVRKAQALLGRDLSTADARMEVWFAITARNRGLSTPAV